ncbi:MAG: ABC transporter ATP-binding protein [Nitratireductor sp.]
MTDKKTVLAIRDLSVSFGPNQILKDLNLDVFEGEILGFVGASGTGKSVLMRTVLNLNSSNTGSVNLMGVSYLGASEEQRFMVDQHIGVMFQHGALFSSMSVLDNIKVPMREYLDLPEKLMEELARVKLDLVGLAQDAGDKLPSQLSGGMIKRAALARALALDPKLLFLDEPTSGLDPIGAAEFDELIVTLRNTMGLTVYMVTHDLDSLFSVCDRIAVLADKHVLVEGDLNTMLTSQHKWVQSYFRGKRARQIVR